MTAPRLRIATRGSALARWQAEHVAQLLARRAGRAPVEIEFVVVETVADRRLDISIESMGGKGVFVKEVQEAVLDGRADVAVHSAKDLPSLTVDGLVLASITERADPRDVLVGARYDSLPVGAHVATGAQRRRAQLAFHRPDLHFSELRGNIATRLAKAADYDAIVMAKAALDRLAPQLRASGTMPEVVDVLDPAVMTPQVGQGALAIECRTGDEVMHHLVSIEHGPSRRAVDAERAFLSELGGDCTLPAGAFATLVSDDIQITGVLCAPHQPVLVKETRRGKDPELVGRLVARNLVEALGDSWPS
ncbi:MAG TPA: hydroxymethylbilane synthase [Acidimicrobiales bacterium]|nr:hydroxymethylbilane synthase [Acidimicrobiales bacterium]